MRLLSLRLANWKAFRSLNLDFGDHAAGNVFIVEGKNGYGKTSLLEAITLGLHGREGMVLIGRSGAGQGASYDSFLEQSLHNEARGNDATASVELAFAGAEDERLVIQRSWYFSAAARHRSSDEEVRIWAGADEEIVALPAGEEALAFAQDLIADQLLPARLAPFFLFDGEQIDRLAGENVEEQVRSGVEAALGIRTLRQLSHDLLAYAREARRGISSDLGNQLDEVSEQLAAGEQQAGELSSRLEDLGREIGPLRERRDQIVAQIGSLSGESYASFKLLFEKRERLVRARDEVQERLRRMLSVDLALALAGPALRMSARQRLEKESERQQAEAFEAASDSRFERFLQVLATDAPPAPAEERSAVMAGLLAAWTATRAQADEAAALMRHRHLTPSDRLLVAGRLDELDNLAATSIADLARDVVQADQAVEALDAAIADQRGADEQSRALAEALKSTQEQIGALEEISRQISRDRDAWQSKLARLQADKSSLSKLLGAAEPALRRAEQADKIAAVTERLIQQLFPLNLQALSDAVTQAYRAMAHKDRLLCISITPAGALIMHQEDGARIDPRSLSAGERQILVLALMVGIILVSPPFPVFLDTPLARLDPDHRARVLAYLTGIGRQLIFLSQPAELSSVDQHALGSALAAVLRLEHDAGVSRLETLSNRASAA